MKVRHKKTGVELEVRNSRAVDPAGFYITKGESWINKKDPDWQLVPEDVWEDCTGSLELMNGIEAVEPGEQVWAIQCLAYKYRLRKIDGAHNGPAFIVERRKERT